MISNLANSLSIWHKKNGRHTLPWQHKGPYETWISEVMLQQTQVQVVIPYYRKFIDAFPTISVLAEASLDDVLAYWAGLGYYTRARNIHQSAQRIQTEFCGKFPSDIDSLVSLAGIGRSTAGAILSLGSNQRGVIQDGNVRRLFSRLFLIEGDLTKAKNQKKLWDLADYFTPLEPDLAKIHTQAIMDLGSLVCKRHKPICEVCPFGNDCEALRTRKIHELPEPKKMKRQKEKYWVILQLIDSSGRTLWIRQPDDGIWGGLHTPLVGNSLLELSENYQFPEALEGEFKATLQHSFSHFKVTLDHYILRVQRIDRLSVGEWAHKRVFKKGIPTPIKKLIFEVE